MDLDSAARLFAELGNRTRLEIIKLLIKAGRDGLTVGEVQQELAIPASTLAFHLKGLVGAGLLNQEKRGRVVICQPCFPVMDRAVAFLKQECCIGAGRSVRRDAA
jgi:DNA-binding transcriptional ArsR family regulator